MHLYMYIVFAVSQFHADIHPVYLCPHNQKGVGGGGGGGGEHIALGADPISVASCLHSYLLNQ